MYQCEQIAQYYNRSKLGHISTLSIKFGVSETMVMTKSDGGVLIGRTARRRNLTQQKLTTAARKLFSQYGIAKVSVNDITEVADVGTGTFYTYFDSKDEIVEHIAEELLKGHEEQVLKVSTYTNDPLEIGIVAIRNLFETLFSDPSLRWLTHHPDTLTRKIIAAIQPHTGLVIQDLKKQGGLPKGVSADTLVLYSIWGMIGILNSVDSGKLPENVEEEFMILHASLFNVDAKKVRSIRKKSLKWLT